MEYRKELEEPKPNFMTYNGNLLFHYTKFESAVKIISSHTLLFGESKDMNDIAESRRLIYNNIANQDIVDQELIHYKTISFTIDKPTKRGFEIDSLWGYYAEKGNGVCLVFDKNELIKCFNDKDGFHKDEKIKYRNNSNGTFFLKSTTPEDIAKEIKRKHKKIFFTKSKDWGIEQEYRLLIRGNSSHKDSLDFGETLIAVIICMPLAEDHRIKETSEYLCLKRLVDVPILHYHTMLGTKTLTNIDTGIPLWPIHNWNKDLDV